MKLKKLLASVTAAALAVTTMAVTSFTASAATENIDVSFNEYGCVNIAADAVDKYSSFSVTVTPVAAGEGEGKCGHKVVAEGEEPGRGEHPFGTTECDWWGVKLTGKISEAPWSIDGEITKQKTTGNTVEYTDSEFAAWKENEKFAGVDFSSWGCTITSIVGTLKETAAEATYSVKVTPTQATVKVGETTTLTGVVQKTENGTTTDTDEVVVWVSNDPTIATVDDGVVTGVKAGTVEIRAYRDGDDTNIAPPAGSYAVVTVTEDGGNEDITDELIEVKLLLSGITNIIFSQGDEATYIVAGKPVSNAENTWWVQVDAGDKSEYKDAFNDTSMTFKANKNDSSSVGMKIIVWNNDAGKAVAHEVVIDLTKAVNGKVEAEIVAKGDIGTEQQNKWYYLQAADVKYATTTPPEPVDPPVTGDKTFEGSVTIEATPNPDGNGAWGSKAFTNIKDLIGDLDPAKTTIVFSGSSLVQIGYNSVKTPPNDENSKWLQIDNFTVPFTFDASDIVIDGMYFQIGVGETGTITWVATEKGDTPTIPVDPPATDSVLWSGTQDFGNWADTPVNIEAEKFAGAKAGDTIKFTYSINAVPDQPWNQIKIMDGTEAVLASPTGQNEWNCVDLASATTYSFEISAADLALVQANGMKITGHGVVLSKVELVSKADPKPPVVDPDHTHTPADAWKNDSTGHWHVCSGCTEKIDFAAHTFDNGTVTTEATATTDGVKTFKCTVCGYTKTETIPATGTPTPTPTPGYNGAPVIPISGAANRNEPSINGQSGWDAVSAEIAVSSDGDSIKVSMNNVTRLPSSILKDIEGKDVDLVLDMGRGITWTVNGLSVTNRKTANLGFNKNSRDIPDEVVEKAEGRNKKQISLDHNGNFGFTAVMTYDIGSRYNGLYANIFYYNPKTKELELSDCSLISGGKASFVFAHASDYLITVTDEPLGEFEDVSSAAGAASDNSTLGNGIALSAAFAMIVLGFGIVVYRKRRHN